jgi:hypothetical protein
MKVVSGQWSVVRNRTGDVMGEGAGCVERFSLHAVASGGETDLSSPTSDLWFA